MSKEDIPKNLIIDTLVLSSRWVLNMGIIAVALIAISLGGFFAYEKYKTWNNELVILVAIKCGPTLVDPSKFGQEKIISFRGTRKNKEILKIIELIPKSVMTSDDFSDWKERYGFEWQAKDVEITRDYYITEKKLENGKEIVSYNRKNLKREFKKYLGTQLENKSIRQCEEISVKEYNAQLKNIKKLFMQSNKI